MRYRSGIVVLGAIVSAACAKSPAPVPASPSVLITNASVIDGSGSPAVRASVRVEGDRIATIGNLTPHSGETPIGARGLVSQHREDFVERPASQRMIRVGTPHKIEQIGRRPLVDRHGGHDHLREHLERVLDDARGFDVPVAHGLDGSGQLHGIVEERQYEDTAAHDA